MPPPADVQTITAPLAPSVRRLALPPTQWLGWTIGGAGLLAVGWLLWRGLAAADPHIGQALLAGFVAAGATALGTLPVLLQQQTSERTRDAMLGFGAGVMLAASAFSLIVPGIAAAELRGAGPWGAGLTVGAGIALGAALLIALNRYLPHEHFIRGVEGVRARALKRTWLFVLAVSLHNFPEGLAIGVAYAGTDPREASALAIGIAIQDVPEGLIISLALIIAGYRRGFAVLLGAVSGLIEPVGAVLGAAVIGMSAGLLPWGLAFAAGAMLWVISREIIPESHRHGHENLATSGLMIGFVLMMILDTALG